MIQAVRTTQAELDDIGSRIRAGGDLQEVARDLRRITKRDGGITSMVNQLRTVVADLPRDMKSDARFAHVTQMLDSLTVQASNTGQTTGPEATIVPLLRERLTRDERGGSVDPDRAKTLEAMIAMVERRASRRDDSIESLIEYTETIRRTASEGLETIHYPSYGIARPPAGSHAAALVEECWTLRRFLMEENIRPAKGSDESHELVELMLRGSNVDRRIYEAGADAARAKKVEHEELRPFALAVRSFSARDYSMFAAPTWSAAPQDADTNALLYAGPTRNTAQLGKACARVGIELIAAPVGSGFADARWQQIQRAMVGVFDFRAPEGPERAAVAYELGIALTLGRPVVVLVSAGQVLPFDVDRKPVIVDDGRSRNAGLQEAIRQAIVSTYAPTRGKGVTATLEEALARYARPHDNAYVDQTLRLLADQREEPDRLAITRTLAKLVQFLDDGKTVLISPPWSPVYPQAEERRLFHVMPFAPDWASDVAGAARAACAMAGVHYVRGDEVVDASVIQSIWEELAGATHVVVDLTGFNSNVALELGIAHTLGRPCLLVGQGDTVRALFPMVAKERLHTYKSAAELKGHVKSFLS